jgi:TolB protein
MFDSPLQSPLPVRVVLIRALTLLVLLATATVLPAQDWVRTGSGLGVEKVRLAVPDFKPSSGDPQNHRVA